MSRSPLVRAACLLLLAGSAAACAKIAGLDELQLVTDPRPDDEEIPPEGTAGSGGTGGAAAGAAGVSAGGAAGGGVGGSAGAAGSGGSAGASGSSGSAGASGGAGAAGGGAAGGGNTFADFWQTPACVACLKTTCATANDGCGDVSLSTSACKIHLNCVSANLNAAGMGGAGPNYNCAVHKCIVPTPPPPAAAAAFSCMSDKCSAACSVAKEFPCPTN